MLAKIKALFNNEPKFLTDSKFKIVPAFELNGIKYYEAENVFNTPCIRALSAIKYYEEMRMKCNFEYLQAWTDAHENVVKEAIEALTVTKGNRLNLKEVGEKLDLIKQRNARLKERLALALDVELVYKLASVVYFDGTENPNTFEPTYGAKKIELWKKSEKMEDFFLRQPIKKLVPFLDGQEANIQAYSETVQKIKEQDWTEVLSLLSSVQKTKYTTASY